MSKREEVSPTYCTPGEFLRPRIKATSFIRIMAGQTQSSLMRCDDGHLYVVKMPCPSQGPNVLANEALGSRLARGFGLPTAADAIVTVPEDVLRDARLRTRPDLTYSWKCVSPERELYGSRFIGEPEGANRTMQYIGSSEIARLYNRADFLGMLILDVWANHQDVRQAVYSPTPAARSLHASFIDHGQMFGGAHCRWSERSYCFYYHMEVYKELWSEEGVRYWMSRFRARAQALLSNYLDDIPPEWYDLSHSTVGETLLDRLKRLDTLLVPYRDRLTR